MSNNVDFVPTSGQSSFQDYSSCNEFEEIRKQINKTFDDVQRNFLTLGSLFSYVFDHKYFLQLGYLTFEEFVKNEYSIARSTSYNLIQVYKRFCEPLKEGESLNLYNPFNLKKEFKDYNFSQLCELVSIPDEDLSKYDPSQSVKEIRTNKALSKALKNINYDLDINTPNKMKKLLDFLTKEKGIFKVNSSSKCFYDFTIEYLKTMDEETSYSKSKKYLFNILCEKCSIKIPFYFKFDYRGYDLFLDSDMTTPYLYLYVHYNDLLKELLSDDPISTAVKKKVSTSLNKSILTYLDWWESKNKDVDSKATEMKLKKMFSNGSYTITEFKKLVSLHSKTARQYCAFDVEQTLNVLDILKEWDPYQGKNEDFILDKGKVLFNTNTCINLYGEDHNAYFQIYCNGYSTPDFNLYVPLGEKKNPYSFHFSTYVLLKMLLSKLSPSMLFTSFNHLEELPGSKVAMEIERKKLEEQNKKQTEALSLSPSDVNVLPASDDESNEDEEPNYEEESEE